MARPLHRSVVAVAGGARRRAGRAVVIPRWERRRGGVRVVHSRSRGLKLAGVVGRGRARVRPGIRLLLMLLVVVPIAMSAVLTKDRRPRPALRVGGDVDEPRVLLLDGLGRDEDEVDLLLAGGLVEAPAEALGVGRGQQPHLLGGLRRRPVQ
uniref:Uncharacterized protein n=1 Tax=Triticum urartu TaxID=4572 RepID=A0A8R7QWY3_TRIUA